ncbi:hypothetical protein [Halomonas sp. I5-271120]|uniref:hypothetical protein n=1 Tax=Halomonas sp. I5-271120 TaxID=3061632 RepID=UPI002714CC4C|nr:hypothetical protein [Halomonas sp. I5-271120]
MTQETIFETPDSFHVSANRISREVWDIPTLNVAQPITGAQNVSLDNPPVILKWASGEHELLNAEIVAHQLQNLPAIASVMTYEVAEDDLPPGAVRFLMFIYSKLQPCYVLPIQKGVTARRRRNALITLKDDARLQQFIKEMVFPCKDPLQRSIIFQLYDGQLSLQTVDEDLKTLRGSPQKTAE